MDRTKITSQQLMESDKVVSQHPMGRVYPFWLLLYVRYKAEYVNIKFCTITPVHYNLVDSCK